MDTDNFEEHIEWFLDLNDFDLNATDPLTHFTTNHPNENNSDGVSERVSEGVSEGPSCDVEAKLYLKLSDIPYDRVHSKWQWLYSSKLTCVVSVHGIEQSVVVRKVRSQQVSSLGTHSHTHAYMYVIDPVVFDVYEYFGPAEVCVTLSQGKKKTYTYSTTLHHICSRRSPQCQQKEEGTSLNTCTCTCMYTSTSTSEAVACQTCRNNYNNNHNKFWFLKEKAHFSSFVSEKSPQNMNQNMKKSNKTGGIGISCDISFAYSSVKSCISTDIDNDFQLVILQNSKDILCDYLETLSRNKLLRKALAVRSLPLLMKIKQYGYLPLEHALLSSSLVSVEILLRRAGSWCFQYDASQWSSSNDDSDEPTQSKSSSSDNDLPRFSPRVQYDNLYHCSGPAFMEGAQLYGGCIGSALHAAVMGGDTECLKVLLRFLRRYATNIIGWSSVSSCVDMLNWVGSRHDGYSPLMLACALGRTECIRQLLAAGAALDVCTKPYLLSPLMLACSSGSLDSVVELMSHFNSIDSNLSPEIALQIQDKAGVGLMKCSPYSTNIDGKQALGFAAEAGHTHIVAHFLSRKLSYSHADMFGSSALHLAAANGHMEVCKVIVEAETNAMARYYATNFAFRTSKLGGNNSRLVNDQTNGEKNGIIALEISTKSDINAVSKEYSSLPRTAVDDVNSIASTSEIASIKRQRVLTNMTPRPCVLRAVDKRGRTAADVARICGHLFVSSFLKSAEVQGMKSIASYDPAHSHVQDDATLEPDDVADDLAYCFAKTLYFDPSYDSVFRDDETSDYNEHESDSSDLDTCSDCD